MKRPSRPELATCSYFGFDRSMGTPVRISLGLPRERRDSRKPMKLSPRFYDPAVRQRWLSVRQLTPSPEFIDAPPQIFTYMYLSQLEKSAKHIDRLLGTLYAAYGPLVLCCFERKVGTADDCHRRLFAEWWEKRTGDTVPELDGPFSP